MAGTYLTMLHAAREPDSARRRAEARVEAAEYILLDLRRTLACLESKREALQGQIEAACRSGRAGRKAATAAAAADTSAWKGRRAARRRLLSLARGVKEERKRVEVIQREVEEALADARGRLALLQWGA